MEHTTKALSITIILYGYFLSGIRRPRSSKDYGPDLVVGVPLVRVTVLPKSRNLEELLHVKSDEAQSSPFGEVLRCEE
ncbi:hypothetical protein TNCV_5135051 [Trichonephila clavipes]|nr:hypothetical protein TNCV_5135051 [Trichonephila clavipes]